MGVTRPDVPVLSCEFWMRSRTHKPVTILRCNCRCSALRCNGDLACGDRFLPRGFAGRWIGVVCLAKPSTLVVVETRSAIRKNWWGRGKHIRQNWCTVNELDYTYLGLRSLSSILPTGYLLTLTSILSSCFLLILLLLSTSIVRASLYPWLAV